MELADLAAIYVVVVNITAVAERLWHWFQIARTHGRQRKGR